LRIGRAHVPVRLIAGRRSVFREQDNRTTTWLLSPALTTRSRCSRGLYADTRARERAECAAAHRPSACCWHWSFPLWPPQREAHDQSTASRHGATRLPFSRVPQSTRSRCVALPTRHARSAARRRSSIRRSRRTQAAPSVAYMRRSRLRRLLSRRQQQVCRRAGTTRPRHPPVLSYSH